MERKMFLVLMCVAGLIPAAYAASTCGFEAPNFVLGPIDHQIGGGTELMGTWFGVDANVVNTVYHSGAQSVALNHFDTTKARWASAYVDPVNQYNKVELYFRIDNSSSSATFQMYLTDGASVQTFWYISTATSGVNFGMYDSAGTLQSSTIPLISPNAWHKAVITLDTANDLWYIQLDDGVIYSKSLKPAFTYLYQVNMQSGRYSVAGSKIYLDDIAASKVDLAGSDYMTSFELPTFTAGAIRGQDGWAGNFGDELIVTSQASAGSQSLEVPGAGSNASRIFIGGQLSHLSLKFELTASNAEQLYVPIGLGTTTYNIVANYNDGAGYSRWSYYDGDNVPSDAGDSELSLMLGWNTLKVDFDFYHDVYYIQFNNGTVHAAPVDPFVKRISGINLKNGSANYSDTMYYDEISVRGMLACYDALNAGLHIVQDINGDCIVDLSDFASLASKWLYCYDPNTANCN